MPTQRWAHIAELFCELIALEPERRAERLREVCGEDEELSTELSSLVSAHESSGPLDSAVDPLGLLSSHPEISEDQPHAALPITGAGDRVGPYRLVRLLGEGGMGSVWLAERVDGLMMRTVALKLPHWSWILPNLAERMARERDILAALEHPGIARLYDAGVDQLGRPYLALEYIDGQPIDRYCAARNLDVLERLELVVLIARAVAFAHAHLIVHRDLKPSNIQVDARGQVHLLDFGIAKLLDQTVAAESPPTLAVGRAMTPGYAAPEQIRGEPVTTASDVYSMGVVLYELLTGTRPVKDNMAAGGPGPPPNLTASEPMRPSHSAGSSMLRRRLRGDIDVIALKALKQDPRERYTTMGELADDLEHYLRGEPVRARPDSVWYRTRKLLARNKLLTAATAAVILAFAAGLSTALWQMRVARAEARTARAVESFLADIFRKNSNEQTNPAKARATTARELLQSGASMVDEALHDAPASRLRVLGTLAQMHSDLDLYDDAVALNRKRLALARSLYREDDPRIIDPLIDLANALAFSQAKVERAPLLEEALRLLDRRGDLTSRRRALVLLELASYYQMSDLERALRYAEQSAQLLGGYPPSSDQIGALQMQGWLLVMLHRYPEGESVLKKVLAMSQARGGSGTLSHVYWLLATPQYFREEFAAMESNLRRGWELGATLVGEGAADSVQAEVRLGYFLVETARVQEGLTHAAHATATIERILGADDPVIVPNVQQQYGRALLEAGQLSQAAEYLGRATRTLRDSRPGSLFLITALEAQALASVELGDLATAQSLLDEAQEIRDRTGSRITNLNGGVTGRVTLLIAAGRPEEAAGALTHAYLPAGDVAPDSLASMQLTLLHAEVELALHHPDSAVKLATDVYRRVTASSQRAYLKLYEARATLDAGKALLLLDDNANAATMLSAAVALHTELDASSSSPFLADALIAFAECQLNTQHLAEARALAGRASIIQAANTRLGDQFRRPLIHLQERLRANRS